MEKKCSVRNVTVHGVSNTFVRFAKINVALDKFTAVIKEISSH